MIGQMKHILATEQKKTDFRPEDENNALSALQYTTVSNIKFWIVAEVQIHCKYSVCERERVSNHKNLRLAIICIRHDAAVLFLCVLFLGVL